MAHYGVRRMTSPPISKLVIIGRDAALWLAAATIRKALKPAGVAVEAVELPSTLTASDIYATLPALEALHNQLRIDEGALLRNTRGAFSLGQNFADTGGAAAFMHPFGAFGAPIDGKDFFAYWLKARRFGLGVALEDFSLTAAAARQGRLLIPDEESELYGRSDYGYHLPALANAGVLKAAAIRHGVTARQSRGVEAEFSDDGGIATLRIDGGERIAGDLFIDASGSEAVLIGAALNIGRDDWRSYFPVDRILVASGPAITPIPVYAEIRASEAGWTGLYPGQARTHVAHAYSSTVSGDDDALRAAAQASGLALSDAVVRPSDPGRRESAWAGNCVAIGAAACAFDPIHGVDLHAVQLGLVHLLACFPASGAFSAQRAEYNRITRSAFERVRDFQSAHYMLGRYGGAFWDQARTAQTSPELKHIVALFQARGEVAPWEDESFSTDSWRALLIGHGLIPDSQLPTIDRTPPEEMKAQFRRMLGFVREQVLKQPTHDEYLRRQDGAAHG